MNVALRIARIRLGFLDLSQFSEFAELGAEAGAVDDADLGPAHFDQAVFLQVFEIARERLGDRPELGGELALLDGQLDRAASSAPAMAQEIAGQALAHGFEAEALDAPAEGQAFPGQEIDEEPGDVGIAPDLVEDFVRPENGRVRVRRGLGVERKAPAEEGDRLADEFPRSEPGDLEKAALVVELADADLAPVDPEERLGFVPLLEEDCAFVEMPRPARKPDVRSARVSPLSSWRDHLNRFFRDRQGRPG